MKKKFIIFTLCFTLIFSSLNYKKSYADMGVLSAPMLGAIATIAAATGIHIATNDDIVDLGRIFYDANSSSWSDVMVAFENGVVIGHDALVTVSDAFLGYCKKAFDSFKSTSYGDINDYDSFYIPGYGFSPLVSMINATKTPTNDVMGDFSVEYSTSALKVYYKGDLARSIATSIPSRYMYYKFVVIDGVPNIGLYHKDFDYTAYHTLIGVNTSLNSAPSFGDYNWDSVSDRLDNEGSLGVYVPSNLDSLVGLGSSDVFNPSYDLPVDGVVTLPGIDNPSIEYEGVGSFPLVDNPSVPGNPSVPNDSIWSTIKDFIISLVVPNDTFWTDTWGGLYNNFTDSFPMVDMSGFNDLVTGEKKFPNIDIDVMGVTGRVVNGDVINSIVDWLRPIIAGFMMICLMLFNYRKIYKLIRNTEPFGGIAPGTSDFRTGISEYKHDYITPTGLSMPYEDFLEHAKTQRKWEMANPGQDYGKAGFTKVY